MSDRRSSHPDDLLRAYPEAREAERAVIQLALMDPAGVMPRIMGVLVDEHFHSPDTRIFYQLLTESYNTGKSIDPVTLQSLLMDRGKMEQVGGPAAVAELISGYAAPAGLSGYLEALIDKAHRRTGLMLAEKLKEAFADSSEPWLPGIEDVEATLMTLRRINSHKGLRDGRAVVLDLVDRMDAAFRHRGNPMGLALGFPDIDRVINGLQPQDFVIVAARPAMGKTSVATAFAEAIALDAANQINRPVCLFTLEMSDVQIMRRSVLGRARVALSKGKTGMFSAAEGMVWRVARAQIEAHRGAAAEKLRNEIAFAAVDALEERIMAKAAKAEAAGKERPPLTKVMMDEYQREIFSLSASLASIVCGSLHFYDGYAVTTQEIRAQIRDWVRRIQWQPDTSRQQPPMVIVDYLQLIKASEKKAKGDPRLAIMEACEMLKGLAKELNIVVMALAQVGRGAEENAGRIPQLKDLKESGAIEEYADLVAFIHRDCYYKPWNKLNEDAQERWDGMAKARNDSHDARTLQEPRWDGESYYNAHAVFAIRKGRDCAQADLDILFRGEFARFSPKTAHLYSNNKDQRQQATTHQEEQAEF